MKKNKNQDGKIVTRLFALNSHSSGTFSRQKLNGRDHIVTNVRPIVGNSIMNKVFYPTQVVKNSHGQLHNRLMPVNHPQVSGQDVSAYNVLAINANNAGCLLRNPVMKGVEGLGELWVDLELANSREDGKEIIRRIENNESIGVSTGMKAKVKLGNGSFENQPYIGTVLNIEYDHVAILLDEEAAGAHVGTQTITNELGEITICNLENNLGLSFSDIRSDLRGQIESANQTKFAWDIEIFPDDKTVIFTLESRDGPTNEQTFQQSYTSGKDTAELIGEPVAGVWERQFVVSTTNSLEDDDMDKKLFVITLIANSKKFTKADQDKLMAMEEDELAVVALNAAEPVTETLTNEQMTKTLGEAGFTILNSDESEQYKDFSAKVESEVKETKDFIIANSAFEEKDLEGKSPVELNKLKEMATPKEKGHKFNLNNSSKEQNRSGKGSEVEFEAPSYDKK